MLLIAGATEIKKEERKGKSSNRDQKNNTFATVSDIFTMRPFLSLIPAC
jgi:hypothetical protein